MYMPPNNGGGEFELTPSGTHLATCYRVIDLGTQPGEWQGQPKHAHKIMLSWEITDELMQDGRPFAISRWYTFSSNEKAVFRQHLEAWRGRAFTDEELAGGPPNGFHVRKLLGVPCLLTVMHETQPGKKTRDVVQSIARIMRGQVAKPLSNATQYLSLDPSEFDRNIFNGLSDGLRATIEKSPEYREISAPRHQTHAPRDGQAPPLRNDLDDEIPF